ncbi:hypothetical protein JOM56_013409 [Amanita muscaria]
MSSITATEITAMITHLDNVIREGLALGNISQVMKQEKAKIKKVFELEETLPDEHKTSFRIKIFLWEFLMNWLKAGKRAADDSFLQQQRTVMRTFDQQSTSHVAQPGPTALAPPESVDGPNGGPASAPAPKQVLPTNARTSNTPATPKVLQPMYTQSNTRLNKGVQV